MTASDLQAKVLASLNSPPEILSDDTIAWRAFAKSDIVYYVRFFGERSCAVNVRDPEPRSNAVDFLASITEADLDAVTPEAPLAFHTARPGTPKHFEIGVVVHPSVAKMAIPRVSFMAQTNYLVFPAFRCEVTDKDDVEDVKYRINKAISWSKWQREPAPVVAMRYQVGRAKSSGGKALMLWQEREAESQLEDLKRESGFIEIENFERRDTVVRRDGGKLTVETSRGSVVVEPDLIQAWLRAFLREGAVTAEAQLGVA